MALGRQRDRQSEMLVSWSQMPRSPGHAFYDRLQAELVTSGFDGFVAALCAYVEEAGRGTVMHAVTPRLSGMPGGQRRRAPRCGEHPEEILGELGDAVEDGAALASRRAIRPD